MRNEKSRPESAKAADQDISETIRPRKCQRPNPWKLEIMRSGLKQVLERKKGCSSFEGKTTQVEMVREEERM